jgi:hypothetical protein
MAKTKGPGLADYAVHLHSQTHALKIRATSLVVAGDWLFLRDATGGVLFAAPRGSVRYAKHLEPGEQPAVAEPAPEAVSETPGPLFTAIIEPIGVDPPPPPAPVVDESIITTIERGADPEPAVDARGRKHGPGGRFAKA